MLQGWLYVCRIQITLTQLRTNWFVSTKTIQMKCLVNCIPLRIRVHSRNIQFFLEIRIGEWNGYYRKAEFQLKATKIHQAMRCIIPSFPRKNAERLKNPSHETESLSETVHGCRILPYLAYIRCASQEKATQRRDFTRSAPGKTIFSHFLPSHEPHSLG